MLMINLLRIMVDVSFFCTFAGFIAAKFGGTGALAASMIQCALYALASLFGKKRALRMLILLPMALCWYIFRNNAADCILIAPAAFYIISLTFKGDYAVSWERQRRIFSVFWKVLPVTVIMILTGNLEEVASVSFPYASIALICSVLLMRSLRHEPEVYCQKSYQLVNAGAVAIVAGAATVFSSKIFLDLCVKGLETVYDYLVVPVLTVVVNGILLIVRGVVWLLSVIGPKEISKSDEFVPADLRSNAELFGADDFTDPPEVLVKRILIALGVILVLVVIFLLFRWMSKRETDSKRETFAGETSVIIEPVTLESQRARDPSPIRAVRAQYRKFMKLCAGRGAKILRSSTSLDLELFSRNALGLNEHASEIRGIYIRARYNADADKDSAERMKKLYASVKKKD